MQLLDGVAVTAMLVSVLVGSTVGDAVAVLVGFVVGVGGTGVGKSRSFPCTLLG